MSDFDYKAYLASREWALKKEQIRQRSRGWCERCSIGRYEQTHHTTYEHIGNEPLEDLLAVCRSCHEFLSGKTDADPTGTLMFLVIAIDRKNKAAIQGLKPYIEQRTATRFMGTVKPDHVQIWDDMHSEIVPEWMKAAGLGHQEQF